MVSNQAMLFKILDSAFVSQKLNADIFTHAPILPGKTVPQVIIITPSLQEDEPPSKKSRKQKEGGRKLSPPPLSSQNKH